MLEDGLCELSQCLKHHSCRANGIAIVIVEDSKATYSLEPVVQAANMAVPAHAVQATGLTVALCEALACLTKRHPPTPPDTRPAGCGGRPGSMQCAGLGAAAQAPSPAPVPLCAGIVSVTYFQGYPHKVWPPPSRPTAGQLREDDRYRDPQTPPDTPGCRLESVCLRPESDSIQVPARCLACCGCGPGTLTRGSDVLAIPWLVTLILALPTSPLATILRTGFLSGASIWSGPGSCPCLASCLLLASLSSSCLRGRRREPQLPSFTASNLQASSPEPCPRCPALFGSQSSSLGSAMTRLPGQGCHLPTPGSPWAEQ